MARARFRGWSSAGGGGSAAARTAAACYCGALTHRRPRAGVHPSKEIPLAASKRPSFLKRQKEQARLARAAEKRTAKAERKLNRTTGEGLDHLMISPEDARDLMSAGEANAFDAREDAEQDA